MRSRQSILCPIDAATIDSVLFVRLVFLSCPEPYIEQTDDSSFFVVYHLFLVSLLFSFLSRFFPIQNRVYILISFWMQLDVYSFGFECRRCNAVQSRETELLTRFTLFARERAQYFQSCAAKIPFAAVRESENHISFLPKSFSLPTCKAKRNRESGIVLGIASISRLAIDSFVSQLHFPAPAYKRTVPFNYTLYTCDLSFVSSKTC